jgi:hypothetical protein
MFAKRRHATQGRTALAIGAVSLAAILAAAVPAFADPMDFLAGNVQAGPLFDADAGANGEWTMPASLTEGQFTGGTVSAGANFYFIDPFSMLMDTLNWTGNPLVNDLSGTGPYAAGQAAAEFGGGGSFTIDGTLYDAFMTPVFTGVLLSGTVSGFSLFEPTGGADNLQIIDDPIFFPVSGALVDGSYASMTVPYIINLTVAGAMQGGGGPLTDFQSDIIAIDSMQLDMTPVPEPASVLLLLGGAALLSARRK